MQYLLRYDSPVGAMTMASDGEALTGLWFDGQKYFAAGVKEGCTERELPVFKETRKWLDTYFSGKEPKFAPPISMGGATPFRKRIWQILLTIPFGQTRTYGDLAKQVASEFGKRPCAQAVGGAVGHNPISIIIPCHRVVGGGGKLTGYAGGLDRKEALLKLEKIR